MKIDLSDLEIVYKDMTAAYEEMYSRPFHPEDPAIVQHALEETVGYMLPPRSEVHKVAIAAKQGFKIICTWASPSYHKN